MGHTSGDPGVGCEGLTKEVEEDEEVGSVAGRLSVARVARRSRVLPVSNVSSVTAQDGMGDYSPVDIDTVYAVSVDHLDNVGDKGRSGRGRGDGGGEEVGASPSTDRDEDLGVVGVGEGDELV